LRSPRFPPVVALIYVVLGWIWGALLVATHHTELLK
jgi:hypothetical protein